MLLIHAKIILERGMSMIKRNRSKKVAAFAGRSAIGMAAKENPSLYKRYKKYKDLHLEYKKKIEAKYGNRAKSAARRKIR